MSALVRASRSVTGGDPPHSRSPASRPLPRALRFLDGGAPPHDPSAPPAGLAQSPATSARAAITPDDAITRKRRLVALFCKMLGDQLLEGDSPETAHEPLSPRERQTLELLLAGNSEKQIAARLAISRHTVHVYVKSLYKRFGVNSRAELLARWVQR